MKTLSLLLTIFMISIVSANGLGIIGDNSFNIEKGEDVTTEFQITIENQDSFTFYNIELEGEGVATMVKINELDSGQSISVTIKLEEDEEFDGILKIIGEYEAELGVSNKTEIIEVSYGGGIDRCDLSLIKGDSVVWKNNGLDEIKLKDVNTGEYFLTIQDGENRTRIFSEPIVLEYVAVWIIPFTEICTVEVLNDEGLIHSSEYDAEISLNLSILYKETTIEITFLSTSYSLDYNQVKQGEYFQIRNTGSETARIVPISGDWTTFTPDESFNLVAGESRNIEYKIIPVVMQTNQTNKTYIKKILVEGNFPSVEKEISIYIKYANLDEIIGGGALTEEWWDNVVDLGCISYPDNERCRRSISYYNGSSGSGLEFTEESSILFLERYGDDLINEGKERKSNEEFKANMTNRLNSLDEKMERIGNETEKSNRVSESASNTSIFLLILISSSIILVIVAKLILKQRKKIQLEKDLGMREEEIHD